MIKHKKTYIDYFSYGVDSFVPCEVCGREATEVHNIENRGMGGTTKEYDITELMALCRKCHVNFTEHRWTKEFAQLAHRQFMKIHVPCDKLYLKESDDEWFFFDERSKIIDE